MRLLAWVLGAAAVAAMVAAAVAAAEAHRITGGAAPVEVYDVVWWRVSGALPEVWSSPALPGRGS